MSMTLIAIILGIVEGLTEFLPISSTGHLILAGHLLNFEGAKAATFEVFIQLGAILAVLVLYFPRFKALLEFSNPNSFAGFLGIKKLILVSLPALFFGALLHGYIKEKLFSTFVVACSLIVGGLIILIIERLKLKVKCEQLEQISNKQALQIGLFQCLAMCPGVSRSASTIIGGMLLGLRREVAAEFSFFAAVPILAAAAGLDLLKSLKFLNIEDLPFFAIGTLVSFITAMFAIRFFIALVSKYSFRAFAYYRIIIGLVFLFYLAK